FCPGYDTAVRDRVNGQRRKPTVWQRMPAIQAAKCDLCEVGPTFAPQRAYARLARLCPSFRDEPHQEIHRMIRSLPSLLCLYVLSLFATGCTLGLDFDEKVEDTVQNDTNTDTGDVQPDGD